MGCMVSLVFYQGLQDRVAEKEQERWDKERRKLTFVNTSTDQ